MLLKKFWFGLVVFLFSCSSQIDIELFVNGESSITVQSKIQQALKLYWNDLKELDSSLPSDLIEASLISGSLKQNPEVHSVVSRSNQNENVTQVRLKSWQQVLRNELSGLPSSTFRISNNSIDIPLKPSLYLKTANISVDEIFPEGTSIGEIEKSLVDIFQDYTANPLVMIRDSQFQLSIKAPRPVISSNGILGSDNRTVRWNFSLVQALNGQQRIRLSW